MLEKTKGIVLHHLKYGDSSLIVHIYTEHYGRKSFLIKGARSKKAKLRSNLFSVLNILDLEFYYKEGKELLLIKEANRAKVFITIPFDIKKSLQAMFIAEVLNKCLIEEVSDPDLFEYLLNSLEYFDLTATDTANFHLSFLMKLTKYLGILPSAEEKDGISFLDLREGKFSISESNHFQNRDKQVSQLLYALFKNTFKSGLSINLDRTKRNLLLEEIILFYTLNNYKLDKLKSLDVLKEVFS